ncbi:putative membrane protein [Rhizocola hellebori]|uniref:Putative membrane protein n=1 Tax=Rhizocola hellebori TaxID=1392758 RepID=A0A8J3VGQ7_9ACTN|nr:MMPL family transporter [Rhizocola hellebori]GIH06624.1 putative membrane protein [Rhizocola hellebori]
MTEFVGKISYRHRWLVVLAWLIVMAGGVVAAGTVFERMDDSGRAANTESGRAREVLRASTDRGGDVVALWEGIDAQSAAATAGLTRAAADLAGVAGVKQVEQPRIASDGKGVALRVVFAKGEDDYEPVLDRLRLLAPEVPGSTVAFGGSLLLGDQIDDAVQEDLGRAELSSLPLTVLVMLFVFGGLIAAGVPLLATLATVAGAFAVLLAFSEFIGIDADIISVVTMLGLALCIDYSLLLVARYREELAAGHEPAVAVARTWATAGRTIAFSALTVAAALTGLFAFDVEELRAMGAAGISATVVALLSALTLTAALLRIFGRRIKPAKRVPRGAFFSGLAAITQRRPLVFALGTAIVLLALGFPLINATLKEPDLEGIPRTIESVRVLDSLSARYGLSANPGVVVVARTDPSTLDTWAARWRGGPVREIEPSRAVAPGVASVAFHLTGDNQAAPARDLVARMRADRPAGVDSWVSGDSANIVDLRAKLAQGLPYALAVIVVTMFILLFLMTGSVVVPVKALLMNFVSLGATFGVLVAVFEHGWLAGPLDTLTVGGLSPHVMVLVFAFGFGLSMDYEVFLLARVKEFVDAGYDTNTAVRRGLQSSGRIITSAALLMLIVFGFFASAKIGDIEQIGLGLFVAVLVDVTIVRCLLVPATMTLLGRHNWWAPHPLRRLHARFGLREPAPTHP